MSAVANIGITKLFRQTAQQLNDLWPAGVPKTDERAFVLEDKGGQKTSCIGLCPNS